MRQVDHETAQRMVMLFDQRFTVTELARMGHLKWLVSRCHITVRKHEDTSLTRARLLAHTLPGGRWGSG